MPHTGEQVVVFPRLDKLGVVRVNHGKVLFDNPPEPLQIFDCKRLELPPERILAEGIAHWLRAEHAIDKHLITESKVIRSNVQSLWTEAANIAGEQPKVAVKDKRVARSALVVQGHTDCCLGTLPLSIEIVAGKLDPTAQTMFQIVQVAALFDVSVNGHKPHHT